MSRLTSRWTRQMACSTLVLAGLLFGAAAPGLACYGAAAMGMGGAHTAMADGVLAIYWNQAGLAFTEGRGEVSTTVTTPRDWTNYNAFHGAMVKLTDRVGLGFGRTEVWDEWDDYWPYYTRREVWDTLGVGVKLTDELALGGAVRSQRGRILEDGSSYESTSYDLSAQYRNSPLRLGLLVQDVNQPTETGIDPRTWITNIRPAVALDLDKFTIGIDAYNAEEFKYVFRGERGYYSHQAGIEYRPWGKEGPLALRAGFYQEVFMGGIGFKTQNFFVDVMSYPEGRWTQITSGIRF